MIHMYRNHLLETCSLKDDKEIILTPKSNLDLINYGQKKVQK
jgi:hypothetical protein